MSDFNTVCSELVKHLRLSVQRQDGEIWWYEGTLELLTELLTFAVSKPKTNADRIRAMSDEELAEKFFLFPCAHVLDDKVKCKDDGCKKCWMRWLREECKNEN